MTFNKYRKALLLFFFLSCAFVGCKQPHRASAEATFVLSKYAEFQDHIGETVTLIGRYENLNVNQRADAEPTYTGRIQIVTSDSIGILLETHDLGLRDETEIKKFLGKKVAVTGVISDNCLAWGNGEMASIVAPCIRNIESIDLEE